MSAIRTPGDKVVAVVVTFWPDLERLSALLDATLPQVARVFIVDNGDGRVLQALLPDLQRTSLIALGRNLGIAAAQNAGANAAIAAGADFILLLDQDSVPDPSMVQQLMTTYQLLVERGHRMAAVGPRTPSRGDPGSFVTFNWFRYRETKPRGADSWVFCDLLIASGMLIPTPVFGAIGPMDESLFIDKVDTEWCLRAAARGFRLAGVPGAVLAHSLGEHSLVVWWGRWKHIPAHKPFRYFYIMRNGVLVTRRSYAGWRWRTADFKQSAQMLLFFGIVSPARWQNLRMMFRGLIDGVRGRTGPMPDPP